jgi:cell fate regulator YaaT (PSP1 superfamily)
MKIAEIQFYPWDNMLLEYEVTNFDVKVGDKVIAKTDVGTEIGGIRSVRDVDGILSGKEEMKSIIRMASENDLDKVKEKKEKKKETENYCKDKIEGFGLDMKLVDVHFSLDGSHIIFVFIAPGRVDFRELVKDLTRHFQKSVRMQQIGIRDEAKIVGEIGVCGRGLCCKKVLKSLNNISSDLIKLQQLENKASERLSGICGRLMCCLAYEEGTYKECCKDVPCLGEKVKYDGKAWVVITRHILKRSVNLRDRDGLVVEVEVDKLKK